MRGVELTGQPLSLSEIAQIAYSDASIQLGASAYDRVEASRKVIEEIVALGGVVYGVSTGFGKLADVHVPGGNCGSSS
jgi:histidine ammonia-lyase